MEYMSNKVTNDGLSEKNLRTLSILQVIRIL